MFAILSALFAGDNPVVVKQGGRIFPAYLALSSYFLGCFPVYEFSSSSHSYVFGKISEKIDMVKLKKLRLKNYCGYRNTEFDFTDSSGGPKPLACFFGPNGTGKSSLLEAIYLLSSGHRFYEKDTSLLFCRKTFNPDYDPSKTEYVANYALNSSFATEEFKLKILSNLESMQIEGIFLTDKGEKNVVITTSGVKVNELPSDQMSYAYFIDADHPMNTNKFQLPVGLESRFLELAKTVYGFNCCFTEPVNDIGKNNELYFTDFVIEKFGVKVHYGNMSGGEKKLATLLRHLCNPLYIDNFDMIILDSIEKEVYFARHAPMIDKLLEMFPDKQFFIATHSPILVGLDDPERGISVAPYLSKEFLYPIDEVKMTSV